MKRKIIFTTSLCFIAVFSFSQSFNGKLGYGFSPQGHPKDYSHMGAFLQEVANTCNGGVVLANGSWRDSFVSSGIIPGFQKAICELQPVPYGYIDMSVFGWGTPTSPYTLYLNVPGDTTNNWTNATAKNLFLKMLVNAADSLQPTYFFIGNEISMYWASDSTDYLNWVSFYEQAYDSIKIHSPNSKVGIVFNYEHLSGNGSLIGWTQSYWNSLNVFDTSKIDILGITLYPFFNYSTANAVPLSYLNPLFSQWGNKPISITETGWPADSILANWYCSPQQQVDWVNRFFTMINGRNVESVNWLFLNYLMDQSTPENKLACSIALRDSLNNDRPALAVWLSYCSSTGIQIIEEKNSLSTYPNPFSSQTVLQTYFSLTNATLTMYNIYGHRVKEIKNISGKLVTIQRDNLPSGLYFVRLTQDSKIIATAKLVIVEN